MGFNYDFLEEVESPINKLKKLTSIENDKLGDVVMALEFKKTENETLNLTIFKDKNKNNCITYKANIDVKITDDVNYMWFTKRRYKRNNTIYLSTTSY